MAIPDPDALLRDDRWLKQLAMRIVRDEHHAEDVLQEARLSALRHKPRSERAWLRRVVHDIAVSRLRRKRGRTTREQAASRSEQTPAVDALVQRAELQRAVADAVLGLAPPYRDVILLRYFEGLRPKAIAARTREPVSSVRSRLTRAREMLRGRLDSEYGTRRKWLGVMAALTMVPGHEALAGGILMSMQSKVAVSVVLVLLCLTTVLLVGRTGSDASTPRHTPTSITEPGPDESMTVVADPVVAAPTPVNAQLVTGVVRARGEGVGGARVLAVPRTAYTAGGWLTVLTQPDLFTALAETVTDADGRFRLHTPGRALSLIATADGHGPAIESELDLRAGATGVVLSLTPGSRLGGVVADESGAPVSGAQVIVWQDKRQPLPALVTNAAGEFESSRAPTGICRFVVTHAAHADTVFPDLIPSEGMRFMLTKGGSVSGRVLRRNDRAPVAGARVWIASNLVGVGPMPVSTRTDAAGSFRLDGVATAGRFSLVVDAGSAGRVVLQAVEWASRWKVKEILLASPRTIRGRVVLADGKTGVADVHVRVTDLESSFGAPVATGRSNETGHFEVFGVAPFPNGIGLATGEHRYRLVERPDPGDWSSEFRLLVEPTHELRGVVTDPAGAGIPGVRVSAVRRAVLTDGEGRFVLRSVPRAATITAKRTGYRSASVRQRDATATGSGIHIRLDLARLVADGMSLGGVVTDGAGRPLAGATVRAVTVTHLSARNVSTRTHASTRTWTDGRYDLRGLPDVALTVEATLHGSKSVRREGVRGTREGALLDPIILEPGYVLRGRVEDENGAPVKGAAVQLSLWNRDHKIRRWIYADHRGEFAYRGAPSGVWDARCGTESVQSTVPQLEPIVLRLPRIETYLSGVVLDARGGRVPKASIQVEPLDGGVRRFAQAGLAGRFRIPVSPGRYVLRTKFSARAPGAKQSTMVFPELEAAAGAEHLEIRAVVGKTIVGSVRGPGDLRLDGIRITAKGEGAPKSGTRQWVTARTQADGSFVLPGLRDGTFTVSAQPRDAAFLIDSVSRVVVGQRDLQLVAYRGLEIAGRVTWPGAQPRKLKVGLSREGIRHRWATVDADGGFRFVGLRPGAHRLRVVASGYRTPAERAVEAGSSGVILELVATGG